MYITPCFIHLTNVERRLACTQVFAASTKSPSRSSEPSWRHGKEADDCSHTCPGPREKRAQGAKGWARKIWGSPLWDRALALDRPGHGHFPPAAVGLLDHSPPLLASFTTAASYMAGSSAAVSFSLLTLRLRQGGRREALSPTGRAGGFRDRRSRSRSELWRPCLHLLMCELQKTVLFR